MPIAMCCQCGNANITDVEDEEPTDCEYCGHDFCERCD